MRWTPEFLFYYVLLLSLFVYYVPIFNEVGYDLRKKIGRPEGQLMASYLPFVQEGVLMDNSDPQYVFLAACLSCLCIVVGYAEAGVNLIVACVCPGWMSSAPTCPSF